MRFGQLITHTQPDLVISSRYDQWMKANANPRYSPSALAFFHSQITALPRNRAGTISSSSMASCSRKQMFTFLGMPELPPTPKLAAIFQNGQFMHLRWQMAGLTEGFLTKAEVSVPANRFNLSGTIDAIACDGSITEFKSINSNGFREVQTFGPKQAHQYQLATYMLSTSVEVGRFIYENKDTQEYVEIPFTVSEEMSAEIELRADGLWDMVAERNLPEPLSKCIDREGYEYQGCPFRDRCLGIQNWKGATIHE